MAPFNVPKAVGHGFKERIESLIVQGDRLYVGTAIGSLYIYSLDESAGDGEEAIALVESKKNFSRRTIEQLGFIKDVNSLVVLSDAQVTLFPLPTLAPPTALAKTKTAFSFAIHTAVQHLSTSASTERLAEGDFSKTTSIPTLVTQLVVGCRRKIVVYTWTDGEAQEPKEAPLPHSARTIAFLNHETVCLGYTPTDYTVFSLRTFVATDVITPLPTTTSVPGMGALTGLSGYMTLGLGAKQKPGIVHINDNEVLISKDNGFAIGVDGKPTRPKTVDWIAPPDEIAFVKPHIFAVLPPGSVPSKQTDADAPAHIPSAVIQIHSSISFLPTQALPFPFSTSSSARSSHPSTIRLITAASSGKSMFFVTTPTERAVATAEGSTIWQTTMKSWGDQVDELVAAGAYANALALLDVIDQVVLPDKESRRTHIRALHAVSLFQSRKFDAAIDTFIELDINPAKVVALYPESVAGRLSIPHDAWIPLYGGPASLKTSSSSRSSKEGSQERPVAEVHESLAGSASGAIREKLRSLSALMPTSYLKDDDTASISSKKKVNIHDDMHRSVETLLRYLTDRRPKVAGALAALHITPAQSHQIPFLSETSTEDLFALPNAPLQSLTPDQLLRFAQILDTALFKSYLLNRPGLIGSLCRVANWCEVSEVEEELRAREKFAELIYLYNGKKMHSKALDLLRQLSEKETDMRDKLTPSISYLQKLGPEHIEIIFQYSRWLFEQDRDIAFEIFTSEDVELPRQNVADYLESIDPAVCARFLEFLIEERNETSAVLHDRLAELHLSMTLNAKKRGDEKAQKEAYGKLLKFIDDTHHYRIDRLYGMISSEDLFEARAILLGRLGRHDQALELYAYRLQDYQKAEEYCKRVYRPNESTSNVFLTLLRIYLRPTVKTQNDLLQPALDLIRRHSPRLDALETLNLLPPLVTAQGVQAFLIEALRGPVFDTRVIREIGKARNDNLARQLMLLQTKRVKVTDSRICPQCHKRIGNSVIAVHVPRGEVTHYQCREVFSKRLKETRR